MKKIKKEKTIGIGIVILLFWIGMTVFLTQEKLYWNENITEESLITPIASNPDIQEVWNRTWGGTNGDVGMSIWDDNIYLYTIGYTNSFGAGGIDFALVKWDTDGNEIWNSTWGGTGTDSGISIWSDGAYLYTFGYTDSFGAGGLDFALVKWDTDGNEIWNRTWGRINRDVGMYMWGDDTYLYTVGHTNSFGAGDHDFALVKWDTDGNEIWNRTWGGTGTDKGYSVWSNGPHVYTLGETNSFGEGDFDWVLVKWNKNGDLLWNQTWGGSGDDYGYRIWGEGNYLYTIGGTSSFGAGSHDFALIKWHKNGNIVWNQTWGGINEDRGRSIWGDGNYLYTVGITQSLGAGWRDLALVKWDTDGNYILNRTWGGAEIDAGYSIWGDGSYLYTLGETKSFGAGDFDWVLVKWTI